MDIKQITLSAVLLTLSASASAILPVALPSSIPDPTDGSNPTNTDKVILGNALFFDVRLSSDGNVSCASCHAPGQGGDDGLVVAEGVGGATGPRNSQTILNAGLMSAQFWEGRAPTLEEQAKAPFINPVEMNNVDHDAVVATVAGISGYQDLFDSAFGAVGTPITIDNIVKAIAAFERTLLTPNSPFDLYINGATGAMTADEITGMNLFESKQCTQCHTGELVARQSNTPGSPFLQSFPKFPTNAAFITFDATYDLTSDLGRGAFTGNSADDNRWKVQSLRNIVQTAPYFHNGSVSSLNEAVRIMAAGQLNVTLTETEVSRIVDFLGALSGELPNPTPVVVANIVPTPVMSPGFIVLVMVALSVLGIRRLR